MSIISKIPILNIPDAPIISTTQALIPLADIVDDMVIYKDGGAAIVLETTSLNFGLLSDQEQEAVIASYAALINSLSFSIQILVRTLKKDITNYLTYVDEQAKLIKNPKLAELMKSYRAFITETVKKKNVLGKRFFIVIPFSSLEMGVAKSFRASTTRSGPVPFSKEYALKKAKIVLYPRRDHIIKQANRLGLKLKHLNTQELTELYYEIFNPHPPNIKETENQI